MKGFLTAIVCLFLLSCHSNTTAVPHDQDRTDMDDTVVKTTNAADSALPAADTLNRDSANRR